MTVSTTATSEPDPLSDDFKETVQLQLGWFKENTDDEVCVFGKKFIF